jgi:hypothetical protein
MLRRLKRLWRQHPFAVLWTGICFSLAVIALSATSADSYQGCETNRETSYANYDSPNFYEQTSTLFVCDGAVVDANRDLIAAIATAVMAAFTIILVSIGWRADKHFRSVERAYVKISHRPSGLQPLAGGTELEIEIRNHGTTPARMTEAIIRSIIVPPEESLPPKPNYGTIGGEPQRAFLVENDVVYMSPHMEFDVANAAALPSGTRVFVIGFVDYIDVFGTRHRGGYARIYAPGVPTDLGFVTQDGYNYDRPRVRGEGNDWDEGE